MHGEKKQEIVEGVLTALPRQCGRSGRIELPPLREEQEQRVAVISTLLHEAGHGCRRREGERRVPFPRW